MGKDITFCAFIWDPEKEIQNRGRHGLGFREAVQAFVDPACLIVVDEMHSGTEPRMFCIGKIGEQIATIRFTYRGHQIRIIGAGFWRKGRRLYEQEKKRLGR